MKSNWFRLLSCLALMLAAGGALLSASALFATEQASPYDVPLLLPPRYAPENADVRTAAQEASGSVARQLGGRWQVASWSSLSGTASYLIGSGAEVASALTSPAEVERVALRIISAQPTVFGVAPQDLRLADAPHAMGKWAAHFQQTYQGIDVWGATAHLTFTEGGRLFAMGSTCYRGIDVPVRPTLSAMTAERIAGNDLPYYPPTDYIEEGTALLVLPVPRSDTQADFHLVWRVRVRTSDPLGIWVTHVDAHSGEILWRYNDVSFVNFIGDAVHDVEPGTYCNPIEEQALKYVRVQISGAGEATTNYDGDWTITYAGSDPRTVTSSFYGPYIQVTNQNGPEAQYSGIATPGVAHTVRFNDANSRRDERDAFDAINDIHDFIGAFDPTFPYINQRIQCYVNRTDGYCPGNAWWDGTINFCAAGGSYANTGQIQGVVHHEFGHGIQAAILGSQGNEGLGEGNSDITSNLLTQESIIGRGFYVNNCTGGIRNSNNTMWYPEDMNGQIHHDGQIIAGFHWDFMELLQAAYGTETGMMMAGERWHFGRRLERPMYQPDQVLATAVADDDDGNLENGTPHYSMIWEAASNHGFHRYIPEIPEGVIIAHTPVPSHEEEGDVDVVSVIQSFTAPLDPASLLLTYRVNGGDFIEEALTATGGPNEYHAIIPDLTQTTVVEYYLQARDAEGNSATHPPGAPGQVHEFVVAPKAEVVNETVESGAPGWTHGPVSGGFGDQWHQSTTRNHTPAGVRSWKCGDTGSGDYANLLNAGLVTPPFELLSHSYLHYWQWIEAEESQAHAGRAYDGGLVEIRVDGGAWTQIFPDEGYTHTIRAGSVPGPFPADTEVFSGSRDWHQVNFDLQAFSGTAELRFRFGSDGADVREGWYVDDIVVDGFDLDTSPVGDGSMGALRYALLGSRANPVTATTEIAFQVPTAAAVRLAVFDVAGRSVRTLANESFAPGVHSVAWDGRDDRGHALSSGVYYCRMDAPGYSATRTLVLSR